MAGKKRRAAGFYWVKFREGESDDPSPWEVAEWGEQPDGTWRWSACGDWRHGMWLTSDLKVVGPMIQPPR